MKKKHNERRDALKKIGTGIGLFISLPIAGSLFNSCEQEEGPLISDIKSLDVNISEHQELTEIGGSARLVDDTFTIFITAVRISDNEIKTFNSQCTHQGCTVGLPQNLEIMTCPCHSAGFSPVDGSVINKPNDGTDIAPLNQFDNDFDPNTGELKVYLS